MRSSIIDVKKIITTLEERIKFYNKFPGNEGKKGGYFTLLEERIKFNEETKRGYIKSGEIILSAKIGVISDNEENKYLDQSIEQAKRLCETDQFTSYSTRDEEKGQLGGAIAIGGLIFSFAGLEELANEALMISITTKLNFLSELGQEYYAIKVDSLTLFANYENRKNPFLVYFMDQPENKENIWLKLKD